MKKKYKTIWLRALRGESPLGVYSQGKGKLCNHNEEFCCLGVLQNEVVGMPTRSYVREGPIKSGNYGGLASEFRKMVGLNISTENHLIRLNDEEGQTFPEIANWIEKNL